jgi:hypothetical protein
MGTCHVNPGAAYLGAYPGVGAYHSIGQNSHLGTYPGVAACPGHYGTHLYAYIEYSLIAYVVPLTRLCQTRLIITEMCTSLEMGGETERAGNVGGLRNCTAAKGKPRETSQ